VHELFTSKERRSGMACARRGRAKLSFQAVPYLLGALSDLLGTPAAGIAVLGGAMASAGLLIAVACQHYGLRPTRCANDEG
jgi:hypothetical protein